MTNHPNRGKGGGRCRNPKPAEIRRLREAAGLTQEEAAALLCSTRRTWQDWEAGIARMHPAIWRLLRILTGREVVAPPQDPTTTGGGQGVDWHKR